MKVNEAVQLQEKRMREICSEKGINYEYLKSLLESVKTKKLLKRNNYHQQKIEDIIEKTVK
jgi:hypothetical protein